MFYYQTRENIEFQLLRELLLSAGDKQQTILIYNVIIMPKIRWNRAIYNFQIGNFQCKRKRAHFHEI